MIIKVAVWFGRQLKPSGRNSCPIIRLCSTLKIEKFQCVTLKKNYYF